MTLTTYSRENPSPRYITLGKIYSEVHEEGGLQGDDALVGDLTPEDIFSGSSLYDHIPRVRELAAQTKARSILDYGSGKGVLYKQKDLTLPDGTVTPSIKDYWGVESIHCYDPGVAEYAQLPDAPCDGVVCTDVLEHIPAEDIDWFLGELFRYADKFVYANIASYPARKMLPNGWNAHVTIEKPGWWRERIRKAAAGWRGEAYVFQVLERKRGLHGNLRRLCGLSKWKATNIEFGV